MGGLGFRRLRTGNKGMLLLDFVQSRAGNPISISVVGMSSIPFGSLFRSIFPITLRSRWSIDSSLRL